MNTPNDRQSPGLPHDPGASPPPRDDLDRLLRAWHEQHQDKAAAGRDRLLAALARESQPKQLQIEPKSSVQRPARRLILRPVSALAAAAVVLAALLPFILPKETKLVSESIAATNLVLVPEGGKLEARDPKGNLLGPCALKHTDVKADVSGRFTRVTVTQTYHNHFADKIEAIYTFPLSHRAGVDRMTMTIGDRIIEGEVKEREAARRIYEAARDAGRVASLLEQERPNIFTQSVANIEPNATIEIVISYVEMLDERDGEFSFVFPTVVAPRYIPGQSPSESFEIPGTTQPDGTQSTYSVKTRHGLVLLGPAAITVTEHGPGISRSDRGPDPRLLNSAIAGARPVDPPANAETEIGWYGIEVQYADGSIEQGRFRKDGLGHVGGRWFYCPFPDSKGIVQAGEAAAHSVQPGEPFSGPTDQVPDAHRITPMPTQPPTRAGHDLSISVTIDSGGPGIQELAAPIHTIDRQDLAFTADGKAKRVSLSLTNQRDIPNRDFVLKWTQSGEQIADRVFAHAGDKGGFFAVQLDAPARVSDAQAVPRELVFVVDTSGSMNGQPMAMSKHLMNKAIEAMRPLDTFNIITFAGTTRILWPSPRPNTAENRAEAMRLIDGQTGSGGTEMMKAIEAALRQDVDGVAIDALSLQQLADLPADGREVVVRVDDARIESDQLLPDGTSVAPRLNVREGLDIPCTSFKLPNNYVAKAADLQDSKDGTLHLVLRGTWTTRNGNRLFDVRSASMDADATIRPLRIVVFLTDAEVGKDMAIIDAIKRHRATTRVFSFGVGNSVNRYLIDEMARAGGGEPEYVYLGQTSDADASSAIERFNRRTQTPVLTDIRVDFDGVTPLDLIPDPANIPDLFDQRPVTFVARYVGPATGTMTIRGQTASGPWERKVALNLPAADTAHSSLPTIWARAKIDQLMGLDLRGIQHGSPNPDIKNQIISLGETFHVLSQFTSFVAVDKVRVTLNGQPRLVHIPIELPDQTNWEGYFGSAPKTGSMPRDATLRFTDDALKELTESAETGGNTTAFFMAAAEPAAAAAPAGSAGTGDGAPTPKMSSGLPPPRQMPASAQPPFPPVNTKPQIASPPTSDPRAARPIRKSEWSVKLDSSNLADSTRASGGRSRAETIKERAYGLATSNEETAPGQPQAGGISDQPEFRVLAAVQLARAGRMDDARSLACRKDRPGTPDLEALCTLLSDQKRAASDDPMLIEIEQRATGVLRETWRKDRARAKISQALQADLARLKQDHIEPDVSGQAMTQLGSTGNRSIDSHAPQPKRIVLLLTSTEKPVLEALAKLGFTLEAVRPDVLIAIGMCDLRQIQALAERDEVRRIEPFE